MGIYSVRKFDQFIIAADGHHSYIGNFALFIKPRFLLLVHCGGGIRDTAPFSQIQVVQSQIHGLSSGFPYLEDLLHHKEDALKNKEKIPEKEFTFKNSLDFKQVGFSYNNDSDVISGNKFSLKGEILGLIGPSGAGKTTIVDLLLRLYQSQKELLNWMGRYF